MVLVAEATKISGQAAIGGKTDIKATNEAVTTVAVIIVTVTIVAARAGQSVSGLAATDGKAAEKAGLAAIGLMRTALDLQSQTPKK